jgi:hypothetical protein
MRFARLSFAASIAVGSCAALALVACGGSQAASPGAASAATAASALQDGGSPTGTPVGPNATGPTPSTAPTTTTLTLSDGGDVQGTKLQSSQTSTASAAAANAGPARGPHQSEPGRTVKDIQVIVQSHRDDARSCYDQAQMAHPDPTLKGNLDLKWTIDPNGKVTAISVDDGRSDIHDPGIGKCVMNVIRGITFAVSAKGFETYAHYPFNFNPKYVRPSPPPSP